jgi:hypothetical protein
LEAQALESALQIEEMVVRSRKTDVSVTLFGVAWVPFWRLKRNDASGAVPWMVAPAFRSTTKQG